MLSHLSCIANKCSQNKIIVAVGRWIPAKRNLNCSTLLRIGRSVDRSHTHRHFRTGDAMMMMMKKCCIYFMIPVIRCCWWWPRFDIRQMCHRRCSLLKQLTIIVVWIVENWLPFDHSSSGHSHITHSVLNAFTECRRQYGYVFIENAICCLSIFDDDAADDEDDDGEKSENKQIHICYVLLTQLIIISAFLILFTYLIN